MDLFNIVASNFSFVSIIIILAIAIFWIVQLGNVMSLKSDDMPWKYDKVLWVAIFILVAPLAPFGFIAFRYKLEASAQEGREARDLAEKIGKEVKDNNDNQ